MHRIAQRQFIPVQVQELETLHASFLSVLGSQVPPSVANLYATPRLLSDGVVQWYSSFAGQPIPFTELPKPSADNLRDVLFERLRALSQFADVYETHGSHDPALSRVLRDASAITDCP